ncbi:phage holin family protein [Kurthia populi]|uniref:Phage holin family protein n=1 Tax=Kurthia populi TaxID=1562132 RepID=A0ABW5XYE5_9BACL
METLNHIIAHPFIAYFPKAIQGLLLVYIIFKAMDFATGLLKTWKGVAHYKSRVMREGLIRWIGEMVAIMFVIVIDITLGLNFYLSGATLAIFVYKEGGSIAENLKLLGVNMPGILEEIDQDKVKKAIEDKMKGGK